MIEDDTLEFDESPLEKAVGLADIIDPDSLQRVCMTFARLYDSGIAVFDSRGQVLVDIPAEHPLCRQISEHPQTAHVSCSFDALVASAAEEHHAAPIYCLCGLRYETLAIEHQAEILGRLVLGPYRPTGLERLPDPFVEMLRSADAERLVSSLQHELRRMRSDSPDRSGLVVSAINDVLTVIVQTGYARHLTSQIHIAAIQEAYNELTEKNRRLADSVERLKELDKLKSSFLATVSHELRTPLTSVIGYSEMLLEELAGKLNDEQRDYVRTIMEKGDQLLTIINEILDISKIESGSIQLACEEFEISVLLRQVTDSLMPQARRKGITLEFRVTESIPSIFADRGKTRQVFLNLLSNAIKFTPKGGTVTVTAENSEMVLRANEAAVPSVIVRVRDSGVGIAPEAREQVFEAFYQVDNSSTRQFGGTGLGLSIVKHFVEAHGGRVWIEGDDERSGALFIVHLPRNPPDGTLAARSVQSKAAVGQ